MKNPIFGLRAGILTQLIFLIVAAMLLINVVILKLYEKDLIRANEQVGRLLVFSVESHLNYILERGVADLNVLQTNTDFSAIVQNMLKTSEFSGLAIINNSGETVFRAGLDEDKKQFTVTMSMSAMVTLSETVNYMGSTWGVLWPGNSDLCFSSPLRYKGRVIGGISVISSLIPVYDTLRSSEKFVILYIFIDTVILALVGIYLLSRIVVGPIHRLLRMTEEFEDREFIPIRG